MLCVYSVPKILLNGDYDIFGDGTVKTISTPGHTPGHQSLEVILPHYGVVILSGDLYHTRRNYFFKQMPTFNSDQTETWESMEKIDELLKETKGRLLFNKLILLIFRRFQNFLNF